ncbi:hypothetical protein [Alcanivorax jadensis]|uniref:hypothetical protein n=1 Tax=Alcanivorax jadensis TaxID=64988 RepID=UPI002409C6F4|nr:hypothetical protein [Alcanivorax jadensis]MDF1637845.1 hypothetical protein [Alcanivorax jadensis]
MRRNNSLSHMLLGAALTLGASQVMALQEMSDFSMSEVTGQDGLTVIMKSDNNGLSAESIGWTNDVDGFDADGNSTISAAEEAYEAKLQIDAIKARSVDLTGATLGAGPVTITQTLDVGSDGAVPLMQYYLGVNRVRLEADSLSVPTSQSSSAGSRSFGSWALDASMGMTIRNNGLFNTTYNKAYLKGEVGRNQHTDVLEYANLFYSQVPNSAYMTMHDFHAMWEMTEGTLGIDEDGIIWRTGYGGNWADAPPGRTLTEADVIKLALDFEYLYKDPGAHGESQDFVITDNDRGVMHFGWLGSAKDVELYWRPGGTWYGTETLDSAYGSHEIYNVANKSGGLHFGGGWEFVSRAEANTLNDANLEFRWRLGETSDVCPGGVCSGTSDKSRINFELGNWTMWGRPTFGDENVTDDGYDYPYANNLHIKPASFHFPLIALDAINGSGQGAGGFCWGFAYNGPAATCNDNNSQFINLTPGHIGSAYASALQHSGTDSTGGLAIYMRDGQLQAFSRNVRFLERDGSGDLIAAKERNLDWGLIYALANVDASIYLYPGGNSYNQENGIIADLMLMSQTFDEDDPLHQGSNWDHGTHLMIADTNINGNAAGEGGYGETPRNAMGIGFLDTSFLLAANDTRIMLKEQSGPNDMDYYSGGLDLASPATRFNYKATFGGGILPDDSGSYGVGPRIVQGALLDFNMEGALNVRFSPSNPNDTWGAAEAGQYTGPLNTSKNYLGYSAAARFGSLNNAVGEEGTAGGIGNPNGYGAYLSLGEPGRPDVVWRFANVEGDIAFDNGIIDIRADDEDGDGKPKLIIANNMLIGRAAAGRVAEGFDGLGVTRYNNGGPVPMGQDFKANLMLGENTLGTAVIPSATVYSSITLTTPTPGSGL